MAKKNKEQSKNKKGCLVTSLIAVGFLLLIVAASIYAGIVYSNKKVVDEKFVSLITNEFDTTQFESVISDQAKIDFKQKVQASARSGNVLFDENNNLNLLAFLAKNTYFANNLSLNETDMTILFESVVSSFLRTSSKFTSFNNSIDIQKITIYQEENLITYNAILKFSMTKLSIYAPQIYDKNLPDFYITLSANVDMVSTKPIRRATMQVNLLEGEDNEYAINKILSAFNLEKGDIDEYAYLPFSAVGTYCDNWGTKYIISNAFVIIFKNS